MLRIDCHGVAFDIIGLSYYPWWHGSPEHMTENLNNLAVTFDKDIVIVETAYAWTLEWFDNQNNIIGANEQLLPQFPASPEGQEAYLQNIMDRVKNTWNGRGIGVVYWAPEYIAAPGIPSSWENLALLDNHGESLPAFRAYDRNCTSAKWIVH